MSITIDSKLFAELVGHYNGKELLLFRVSDFFVSTNDWKWSEPVRFKFARGDDGVDDLVDLIITTDLESAE